MSNTIKRTVVALALSAAALGAGAGVASAGPGGAGGWFNAGVGGVQFGNGNSQNTNVGNGGASFCLPFGGIVQC
ncbi:hypothetical protein GCM10023094_04360 [Rhodococcus olei]|uniref:Secreted protein n=1 Tax=Rhodococcus olei TaxID=2161675 RepID=A0ABP8NWG1_9NOCA